MAGIDLNGRIFLNTEGATDSDFHERTLFSSADRSTAARPLLRPQLFSSPENSSDFPDKPWMAINTFAGTSTVGRILVTWTDFGTTDASPILRSYSDDHGVTWSPGVVIHSANTSAQGSQPIFLPDGRRRDYLLEFRRERLWRRRRASGAGGN